MSQVVAEPELMKTAAADLSTIGSTLNAVHLAAAAPTLAVLPAAADEVSASVAHLFSDYGQDYQKLAGQAAVFHDQFVQRLTASANAYASAEAVNAKLLQRSMPASSIAGAAAATPGDLLNSVASILAPWTDTVLIFAYAPLVLLFLLAILAIWAMAGPAGPMLYPL
jgi:hypothetical protein